MYFLREIPKVFQIQPECPSFRPTNSPLIGRFSQQKAGLSLDKLRNRSWRPQGIQSTTCPQPWTDCLHQLWCSPLTLSFPNKIEKVESYILHTCGHAFFLCDFSSFLTISCGRDAMSNVPKKLLLKNCSLGFGTLWGFCGKAAVGAGWWWRQQFHSWQLFPSCVVLHHWPGLISFV